MQRELRGERGSAGLLAGAAAAATQPAFLLFVFLCN